MGFGRLRRRGHRTLYFAMKVAYSPGEPSRASPAPISAAMYSPALPTPAAESSASVGSASTVEIRTIASRKSSKKRLRRRTESVAGPWQGKGGGARGGRRRGGGGGRSRSAISEWSLAVRMRLHLKIIFAAKGVSWLGASKRPRCCSSVMNSPMLSMLSLCSTPLVICMWLVKPRL